ncbi:MAG: MerR family transcriptional regulator [Chitinophagaceae bacterium]
MNAFTIKDLENLSGIKAHTIRIWEQRYNFLKPRRTATNIRYYSNEELKALLNIALLNKYGFKISHIDQMGPDEIRNKIFSLSDPLAVQERIVNELVQEMVSMDTERFEKILRNYIGEKGMERTVMQIIFPFLEKIGILWQTGHINPAQEHLVSNIIRQKLIAAIEATVAPIKKDKTALLFLPEGEHHEMGLLFIHFLLRASGLKTIYLGTNIPLRDVQYVCAAKNPDYVFIHLTATCTNFSFEKFLTSLSNSTNGTPVIVSGRLAQCFNKTVSPLIHLQRSLAEVIHLIKTI